jgi:hypothetical protein
LLIQVNGNKDTIYLAALNALPATAAYLTNDAAYLHLRALQKPEIELNDASMKSAGI